MYPSARVEPPPPSGRYGTRDRLAFPVGPHLKTGFGSVKTVPHATTLVIMAESTGSALYTRTHKHTRAAGFRRVNSGSADR